MTTKKKAPVKSSHMGSKLIGIGALVAATAGAYLLYGSKDAAKNKKAIKGWMLKAKGEILEKLDQMKDIDEKKYHEVVDGITKKYAPLAHVGKTELQELIKETKGHWKNIKKHIDTPAKKK